MMKYVEASGSHELPKQKLEINSEHPTMKKVLALRIKDPALAALVVEQIYDNALIAADILDNPRVSATHTHSHMHTRLRYAAIACPLMPLVTHSLCDVRRPCWPGSTRSWRRPVSKR
jgi:hypothetical protein